MPLCFNTKQQEVERSMYTYTKKGKMATLVLGALGQGNLWIWKFCVFTVSQVCDSSIQESIPALLDKTGDVSHLTLFSS